MASKQDQLNHLHTLLPASEIFTPDTSPETYKAQSATWSTWADKHPSLVLQPTTLASLSAVIKALYNGTLDFAVRNTGTGSVSAEDVILSTHGFKSFNFSPEKEEVLIGAGLDWGEVDALMEARAPGWQVVGARCSWVGVAGSSLVGGLSWLSHEFGMISDPQNLLDMQVVLGDGRVVWASEEGEGELMWALRGGGGNFGGRLKQIAQLEGSRFVDANFLVQSSPHSDFVHVGTPRRSFAACYSIPTALSVRSPRQCTKCTSGSRSRNSRCVSPHPNI